MEAVFDAAIYRSLYNGWFRNGTPVPVKDAMVHLGVKRDISDPMIGVGLREYSGLPVPTCVSLYSAYIVPKALYGLEAIRITDSAKTKLVTFHRSALRSILGLPNWTAVPALHLLSGQLPIEH